MLEIFDKNISNFAVTTENVIVTLCKACYSVFLLMNSSQVEFINLND